MCQKATQIWEVILRSGLTLETGDASPGRKKKKNSEEEFEVVEESVGQTNSIKRINILGSEVE